MTIKDFTLPFIINKLWQKGLCVLYTLLFLMIKKPWYKLCYSWNGNSFCCKGALRKCHVMMSGRGNYVDIAKTANLNNVRIDISGYNNSLTISEGVSFSEGGYIRIQDDNNRIIIGKNTKIINAFFSSADNGTTMEVGEDCLFSDDIILRTSDSHSILSLDGIRINNGDNVHIGNHVWICNGVRIMKGSWIEDDSVVGSNALITGQTFESNVLIAGIPSKVVKQGINWNYKRV